MQNVLCFVSRAFMGRVEPVLAERKKPRSFGLSPSNPYSYNPTNQSMACRARGQNSRSICQTQFDAFYGAFDPMGRSVSKLHLCSCSRSNGHNTIVDVGEANTPPRKLNVNSGACGLDSDISHQKITRPGPEESTPDIGETAYSENGGHSKNDSDLLLSLKAQALRDLERAIGSLWAWQTLCTGTTINLDINVLAAIAVQLQGM